MTGRTGPFFHIFGSLELVREVVGRELPLKDIVDLENKRLCEEQHAREAAADQAQ